MVSSYKVFNYFLHNPLCELLDSLVALSEKLKCVKKILSLFKLLSSSVKNRPSLFVKEKYSLVLSNVLMRMCVCVCVSSQW